MQLSVGFDLGSPLPSKLPPAFVRRAHVIGQRVTVHDAHAVPWSSVFASLREQGFSLPPSPLLQATLTDFSWSETNDAVAAVLGPDYAYGTSNPATDYSPTLPAPHMGFVPPERALVVPELSRGQLASVGEELIVADRLARYLGTRTEQVGPVVHAGTPVRGWRRLEIEARCSVIGEASFERLQSCAICKAPLRPRLGIWIALPQPRLPQAPAALDNLGYDHLERLHPLVVDTERARFLSREFTGGLTISPVFAADSKTAHLIRDVRASIASLAASANTQL